MGLFEKQGISQNTPRTLAAHKCDIERETRAITDDTLKKVIGEFSRKTETCHGQKRVPD